MAKKDRLPDNDDEAQEGGWGWFVVIAVFIVQFFVRGTSVALGVFFVAFVEHFDEGAGKTSWIPSLTAGVSLFIAPVAAAFSKRYGTRKVVAVGGVLCFVSLTLSSFANSVWQLTITVGFLNGVGYGLVHSPSISLLAKYFKKRHSFANGLGYTGIGVGSLALPPLFQYCINLYGWEGALLVFAAVSAHLWIAASLLRPRTERHVVRKDVVDKLNCDSNDNRNVVITREESIPLSQFDRPEVEDAHISNITKRTRRTKIPFCSFLFDFFDCRVFTQNCHFLIFLTAFTLWSLGLQITVAHMAPRIIHVGISKDTTAILLSLYGVGNIIGSLVWGTVCSHCTLIRENIDYYLGFAFLFYATLASLMPLMQKEIPVGIFVFLFGFARSSFSSQVSVAARKIIGEEMFITGFGWLLMFASFGQLVGPPISGYLKDFTGSYELSFHVAGALLIFCALLHLLGCFLNTKGWLCVRRQQDHGQDDEISG
ncbi:monocarboxylate transporter 13-like [Glandiceps talaboti]